MCVELYLYSPNTPSWHSGNVTFTLPYPFHILSAILVNTKRLSHYSCCQLFRQADEPFLQGNAGMPLRARLTKIRQVTEHSCSCLSGSVSFREPNMISPIIIITTIIPNPVDNVQLTFGTYSPVFLFLFAMYAYNSTSSLTTRFHHSIYMVFTSLPVCGNLWYIDV
jgi:hypothetical protein